jgi:N-acetylmuramic acid 6-phosphate etherase
MPTEVADPRFRHIAEWPSTVAVEAMLEGQLAAVAAVHGQIAAIAAAADAAAERLKAGGRLVYVGAGTSGRIAIQDGVELSPTYDWPAERLVFLLAGGDIAVTESVEGAEDDADAARAAIAAQAVGTRDVAICVAASGRTPYTVAALEAAGAAGALTIGVANNPGSLLARSADHIIVADTGSEPIAGSTRMKAGTAQKVALNLLSTTIMLRAGLVHDGLMVNMRVSNDKLAMRARFMVMQIAGVAEAAAGEALARTHNDIRQAVLVARGAIPEEAARSLAKVDGNLTMALANAPERKAE